MDGDIGLCLRYTFGTSAACKFGGKTGSRAFSGGFGVPRGFLRLIEIGRETFPRWFRYLVLPDHVDLLVSIHLRE
jgi:hypothetical protein